jgi:type I restriction enzyme S subunit
VGDEKAYELRHNAAEPGDIIATQRGTVGQVAIVPEASFARYIVSQSQMRLRVDRNQALVPFVYYALTSDRVRRELASRTIATANPHINLGIFRAIEIPLPPLATQAEIVDALSTLDLMSESSTALRDHLSSLRSAILDHLLSGEHRIPPSYDELLSA